MSAGQVAVPAVFAPILPLVRADLIAQLNAPDVALTPLRYEDRPYSYLLRVRATSARSRAERLFFVKMYKSNPEDGGVEKMRCRVARDYDATRRLADAMAHHTDLGVVRPVACYLDHLTIVTEEAPGHTLTAYLESRAQWFPSARSVRQLEETLSHVGRWLRAFQAIDPVTGPIRLADLQEYVDVRLKRLVSHGVYTDSQRQAVLDHLSGLAPEVSPGDLREVLIHADLAPGNVLVSEGCVTVIDLAMVQRGSALHDLSRLHLQLDVLRAKPQFRPALIARLQKALLRGFDDTLTAERPLFRYLGMLHRINHFSTLSLKPERFPGTILSRRVRRVHRAWIEAELKRGLAATVAP